MATTKVQKQPEDAALGFYYTALDFVEKNKAIVIGALVAIALGIGAYIFLNSQKQKKEKDAALMLSKIMPMFEAGDFTKAIDGDSLGNAGLKKIADEFSGTPSGEAAKLYLAGSYLRKNDNDNAVKAYESISSSAPAIQSAAYSGAAVCYDNKKEFAKAASLYKKAASEVGNETLVPIYLENAARSAELAGDKKEALSLFERLKKDYAQSPAGRDADKAIARLKI
jgi:tetratricopeptide (TPR) repeat protein